MRRASIRPARAFIGGSGGAVNGPEPRPLTTCRPPHARGSTRTRRHCAMYRPRLSPTSGIGGPSARVRRAGEPNQSTRAATDSTNC